MNVTRLAFTRLFAGLACALTGFAADEASLKEAVSITQVLSWGETLTAVRLEYTEPIFCGELAFPMSALATDSGLWKYHLFADRTIVNAYVNDSGKKGDVAVYGKYVFLELGLQNADPASTYRSQVVFNQSTKSRPRLAGFNVSQLSPVTTRTGKVIAPATIATSKEIPLEVDDYATFTYKNEATGKTLNYHLYIPKGYAAKAANLRNLPLVVHYPSGDYNIQDWTGKYRGALFTHRDALEWSSEEAQAQNLAFVVTVGGPADQTWAAEHSKSEMQQNYVKIIGKLLADYNVDASRIYAISLAGGSPPMWNTILANPKLFAAQISTAYDPYHAYRNAKTAEDNFAALLKAAPGWFFAGLHDTTGLGILGANDPRRKGERLRDIAALANKTGANVEIAYGSDGELMWNGLLRGEKAAKLANEQLARAKTKASKHLVTVYMPGTVTVNQHWSWDPAYANPGVRNWLFQQVNSAPYAPAK